MNYVNPLNAELNPICHLLALLGAHHILHVSRIRVNVLAVLVRAWTPECSDRCILLSFSCIPPDYWFDGNFKETTSSPVYLLCTARHHSRTSFDSKKQNLFDVAT
jgi:hypothetical protein